MLNNCKQKHVMYVQNISFKKATKVKSINRYMEKSIYIKPKNRSKT